MPPGLKLFEIFYMSAQVAAPKGTSKDTSRVVDHVNDEGALHNPQQWNQSTNNRNKKGVVV